MSEIWPFNRIQSQPQALHFSYEKAGLFVADQPIPWNAEAVLVEGLLRLAQSHRNKADFQLRVNGSTSIPAEALRNVDGQPDRCRVLFRMQPITEATEVQLCWRDRALGDMTIPVLARDTFINNLVVQMPTVFARLGDDPVPCQTFVSQQSKGLLASCVLTSATALLPLLDLDLQVEFRCERGGLVHGFPARLCSSQLIGRQAMITVAPNRLPKRMGEWTVRWLLGEHCLSTQRVRAISLKAFQRSLRVSDTRFFVQHDGGEPTVARNVPKEETPFRIGPCFLVCSREVGMAGICRLQVRAQVPDAVQPPLLLDQDVLITDGPTVVAPGTIDSDHLQQLHAFELWLNKKLLGALPLCPAPTAHFNGEGGFSPLPDYLWTSGAEDELNERLAELIDEGGTQEPNGRRRN